MEEEVGDAGFVELTFGDELLGFDAGAFLEELAGVRGHGPGEDTANVGVMGAGGDVEDDIVVAEGWGDDGDIGQMSSAVRGMVGDQDIAALQLTTPDFGLFFDASGHAT